MDTLCYSNTERMGQGQGWDHDEGYTVRGTPVRIQVRHDTSYPFQSYAKASIWLPGKGWVEAATYLAACWAKGPYATTPDPESVGGTVGLWEARAELAARTETLVP